MAKKKMTKRELKEKKDKAALRLRIADIVSGACGRDMELEDWVTIEEVGRVVGAIGDRLNLPKFDEDKKSYLVGIHTVEHYDCVDEIVKYLWENGVKA